MPRVQSTIAKNEVSDANQGAKPLRVLIVAPSFDILGGQSVQAARLITRLQELPDFKVGFLPINPRLPGLLRKLQSIKYLRTVVTSLLYVANLLAQIPRYDVIHVFSASYFSFVLAPTPAILIGKLFRKRVLLNYHSGEAEDHLKRWPSAVATIRLADSVCVPSEYLARIFAKFGLDAAAVNNIIELDSFTFRQRCSLGLGNPVVLSNRNLETHYGVDHVLRAFKLIQKQLPDAELIVAGDGSQRVALENLVHELDLQNVKFVGRIEPDAIVELYEQADVYLNGSEIDNQPLSILEAFACGLPVVTTDAGGIPYMVTDEETGFVVSCGDHTAIAARAFRLFEEPGLTKSITAKAHEECQRYGWDAVRDEWIKLYRELARPRASERAYVMKKWIGRLRRMRLAEVRVRGSQVLAARAERAGWSSLTRLPSDQDFSMLLGSAFERKASGDNLLKHFRARRTSFFPAFDEPAALIAELRSRWPEAEAEIVAEADRILAGQFDLLGFKSLDFGQPINWQVDPVSGKTPPSLHWSRVDYLNADVSGDHKIIWELNRHQHFLKLGQAYWLTRDEKYAQAFVSQLNSWMDQNPPKAGINWTSSLEVAFRSISWLWAFHYFRHSASLDSQTFARALKFLYLSGRHLETFLSTYFSPNTHLTGEALGLFYLGTVLPEFKTAHGWRKTGKRILLDQLQHQVRPDGVYFEQSSYYHRYTTDFYTHFLILSGLESAELAAGPIKKSHAEVEEKLQALLDHLMYITRPDGTSPLFGDDDGGRLVTLDRRPRNDFRAALSTGAAWFGRGDHKFVAGEFAEETLWLLGAEAARAFDEIQAQEPAVTSKDFPKGGYYVMRDGWHPQANYLLFDCGPHGTSNCGHAHADALSIEVAANGRPLLIDPGTYTYTGSKALRDRFRGSTAHNVLLVDGEPSSVPAGPFSWKTIARCEPLSWISEGRFDFVSGRHDGYERLPNPATHTRSLLFLKNDYWIMRDHLSSSAPHDLNLRFHFVPETSVESLVVATECVAERLELYAVERSRQASLQLVLFGQDGRWRREESAVSQCYGDSKPAPVGSFSAVSLAKQGIWDEVITMLLPGQVSASQFEVREVEAIGGRAFEIVGPGHCDLLVLKDSHSERVETVRLVSDFNWSWVRFPAGNVDAQLEELLVIDGQLLELDGNEIVKSGKHVDYLMAARAGDRFRVETNEGLLDLSFPIGDALQSLAESNEWERFEI